jgi:hypothetical protein
VESVTTRFVIDSSREPCLSSIESLFVKPVQKLFELKEFKQNLVQGEIKVEAYARCLHQYGVDYPPKVEPNLHQPLTQQRGYRCRGDFCDVSMLAIPHLRNVLPIQLTSTSNCP